MLYEEVEIITQTIETTEHPRPYDFCRRGAILRKLGRIEPAFADLTRAIELERARDDTAAAELWTKIHETETDPLYAASRLWVDAIIDPRATRRVIADSLEACANKTELDPFRVGVFQT